MRRSMLIAVVCFAVKGLAADPPVIPVGPDAYRMWDKWPYQRIGARAYMRSTYDRRGGNEGADASHFLYQAADDFNVALDVAGPGVLYFVRCNHWHGSPWHYEVDGRDHIVQESSTVNPNKPASDSVFMPEELFPNPLTWTWSVTKGADLMWVPIAFERTFRLAYSRTHYGTGYFVYHIYDPAAELSRPVWSWDGRTPPVKDVLDLIGRAGSNIAPKGTDTNGTSGKIRINVDKASMLRLLSFSVPREEALGFGRARIRATWDDLKEASVDAPVALFFGAGTLYNRDNREFLVKAFPMNVRFDSNRVHLACYFPMPFRKSARVDVIGYTNALTWTARYDALADPFEQVAYFHATYRDFPEPEKGKDMVLLDTREAEGGGDWSGNFVGTSWIFSHRGNLNTLEGDPRFFFDDSQTPQAYGTGTEEWGGGGDYWGGRNMTLPFAGHPCGAANPKEAKEPEDLIQSAYRFLLADLMPFGKNAVIRLEHGGQNESTEHYETVTYWYGANKPTLIKTDELKIGDSASEQQHGYKSPDASEPYEITSRYEWGVDKLGTQVVFEAHSDRGRKTKGTSEFNLKTRIENYGVLLRRKLDYSFADQRAEVYVDDELAGIWYLAGSNTCIYSNPKDELGATEHNVQTSNRRFRDEEFIISRKYTRGKTSIRVKVKFMPVERPLFPGQPVGELAWSEIRYDAYCWVMPQ